MMSKSTGKRSDPFRFMRNLWLSSPRRIALAYVVFGVFWIVASEKIVDLFFADWSAPVNVQILKKLLFITITALFIHHLASRVVRGLDRFRLLVESAPEAIFIQKAGLFAYVNPAAVRLFGAASAGHLLGLPVLDRYHPDHHATIRERIRLVNEERRPVERIEASIVTLAGERVTIEVEAVPFDVNGLPGALVFVADVSSQRRVEKERDRLNTALSRARRMELVGRLAGGLVHDFNNMLTIVHQCADLLDGASGVERGVLAEEIRAASTRSATLARRLLTFARRGGDARIVDLNALFVEVRPLLIRSLGDRIELSLDLAPALHPVRVEPAPFEQVLINLVFNARDALAAGVGRITIETRNERHAAADRSFFGREIPAGEYVVLRCRDNGRGMTPEILDRVFEPFFTTKPAAKGTGLGLFMIHGVVTQSGGFIGIESRPGAGTTVEILLPRAEGEVATAESAPALASVGAATGALRILFVEDEEGLRKVTRRVLERLGHEVTVAASAEEALAVPLERLDLLITDLLLPGMSGLDLARRLEARRPGLGVILASGSDAAAATCAEAAAPDRVFLAKPFARESLEDAIRRAVRRTPDA